MTMPFKKKFVILDANILQRLIQYLYELPLTTAPNGWKVVITENVPIKKREQEEKYHAMITDIRKSGKFEFLGRRDWNDEEIKRFLIDAFAALRAEEGNPLTNCPTIYPSLDGKRVVHMNPRSSEFTVKEASEFIEYLGAYGADLDIKWSKP